MAEFNWAEHDQQIMNAPTDAQCYNSGYAAYCYGWSCTPWGHWTDAQKAEHRRGYDAARANGESYG